MYLLRRMRWGTRLVRLQRPYLRTFLVDLYLPTPLSSVFCLSFFVLIPSIPSLLRLRCRYHRVVGLLSPFSCAPVSCSCSVLCLVPSSGSFVPVHVPYSCHCLFLLVPTVVLCGDPKRDSPVESSGCTPVHPVPESAFLEAAPVKSTCESL